MDWVKETIRDLTIERPKCAYTIDNDSDPNFIKNRYVIWRES